MTIPGHLRQMRVVVNRKAEIWPSTPKLEQTVNVRMVPNLLRMRKILRAQEERKPEELVMPVRGHT